MRKSGKLSAFLVIPNKTTFKIMQNFHVEFMNYVTKKFEIQINGKKKLPLKAKLFLFGTKPFEKI